MWLIERGFFYPKLAISYNELNLISTSENRLNIFDVGANRGQSIKFFTSIFPNTRIYAFEPSASTFESLKTQSKSVKGHEIFIYQIGLGSVEAKLNFFESPLSETSTFVLPEENSKYLRFKNRILLQNPENAFKTVLTRVSTVDRFCQENSIARIDIMKIDVEGFELEVLLGAQGMLVNGKISVIQLERHADDMRKDDYPKINKLLIATGYSKILELKHPIGDFYELLYWRVLTPSDS